MGNAFPHNYADAGDDARGMMVLEWDEEPEFHSWPNQPVYRVYKLSEVLDNPEGLLIKNAHVRVHLDIDISYEESNFIREQLIPEYQFPNQICILTIQKIMNLLNNYQISDKLIDGNLKYKLLKL